MRGQKEFKIQQNLTLDLSGIEKMLDVSEAAKKLSVSTATIRNSVSYTHLTLPTTERV